MEIINSETFREILEDEIGRHTLHPFELLIVEDIAQWSVGRVGNLKGNPPALAIIDGQSGKWLILLRQSINQNWAESIISRIEFGGFMKASEVLNSPDHFLRHIVLHELAHLENHWGQDQEEQYDEWAFQKLGIEAI